ncbi:hypothetical protein PTMSG1_09624 [Pyrenophora teres f. maculata]|nr:hypothetical protein PTMSG1_09624 [Pyrenophora teres f. maculata]
MRPFACVALFSLISVSSAWFNCNAPVGGSCGSCTGNNGDVGYFACDCDFPCAFQGNGCTPIQSGIANCGPYRGKRPPRRRQIVGDDRDRI